MIVKDLCLFCREHLQGRETSLAVRCYLLCAIRHISQRNETQPTSGNKACSVEPACLSWRIGPRSHSQTVKTDNKHYS